MDGAAEPGITVRWLVAQPALKLVVLAGAAGLDRRVTFAHSIELAEPWPWLRGGEVVLTTGLRMPADPLEQREYLRLAMQADVAAVGFGVGLSHTCVPHALVVEADEIGLPLVEVPLVTPFVAVVRTVTERLAEIQYEGVVRASRLQPRMTRAALRHGPAAVLRALASAVGGEATVVHRDGTVMMSSAAAPHATTAAALAQVGSALHSDRAVSSVSAGPHGVVSVQAIRVGQRVHGHLVLSTPRRIEPADHLLVGHAVSLIVLEAAKPLRVREEQASINRVVLELLIDGSLSSRRAVDRLEVSGLSAHGGLTVLVLTGGAPAQLLAVVENVLLPLGLPRVGLDRGEEVVVVLPTEPAGLVADVVRAAAARLGQADVYAGVAAARADDLVDAMHLATTAAHSARSRRLRLVDATSLAGHVLIADPAARVVLSRLADSLLGPLVEHDRTTGSGLVATLRAFLEHNGHVESAAVAMGIHRHTLRARMDRTREVLDVDLDSAHVRAELLLALSSRSP